MSGVFIFHKTTKVTRGKNFAALCLRKLSLAVHKIECPIYFYRSLMCQFLENANINDDIIKEPQEGNFTESKYRSLL